MSTISGNEKGPADSVHQMDPSDESVVEKVLAGDTAEALGIPEETVRTRLHRARGLLREELEQKLDNAAPRAYELHLSRCDRVVAAVLARIRTPA